MMSVLPATRAPHFSVYSMITSTEASSGLSDVAGSKRASNCGSAPFLSPHTQVRLPLPVCTGAHGVVVPMVNTRQEALDAVAACRYPPVGNRSVGGVAHALNFQATPAEYYAKVNDEVLIVLQCEHIDAVNIADEIYSVPGIDAIFVGPNDLTYSMRSADGSFPDKETFEAALTRIREAAQRNKGPCGLHVFSAADAIRRAREGWQFIAVNSELKMMLEGASDLTKKVHGDPHPEDLAKY